MRTSGHAKTYLGLANVIVVGDVDAGGNAPGREGDDVEGREVWPEEGVLLEVCRPRQHRNELCRLVHLTLAIPTSTVDHIDSPAAIAVSSGRFLTVAEYRLQLSAQAERSGEYGASSC
eukprot:179699-Rhodomonas_salina.6